jgi:pilus assembly protein Flp/PilA
VRDQKDFAVKNFMYCFLKDETAATAIEYGLIAAGISVVIIAAVASAPSSILRSAAFPRSSSNRETGAAGSKEAAAIGGHSSSQFVLRNVIAWTS